jgi:hypothetical protein
MDEGPNLGRQNPNNDAGCHFDGVGSEDLMKSLVVARISELRL